MTRPATWGGHTPKVFDDDATCYCIPGTSSHPNCIRHAPPESSTEFAADCLACTEPAITCRIHIPSAATPFVPAVGDRVRIVLEGKVAAGDPTDPAAFCVGSRNSNWIVPSAAHVVSVEKLEAAEPEWLAGDVVLDAYGQVWEWAKHENVGLPWLRRAYKHPFSDSAPKRPLRLLVRGGETVAAATVEGQQGKCEQ